MREYELILFEKMVFNLLELVTAKTEFPNYFCQWKIINAIKVRKTNFWKSILKKFIETAFTAYNIISLATKNADSKRFMPQKTYKEI